MDYKIENFTTTWIQCWTEFLKSLTFLHFLSICFSENHMQKGHQKHNVLMSNDDWVHSMCTQVTLKHALAPEHYQMGKVKSKQVLYIYIFIFPQYPCTFSTELNFLNLPDFCISCVSVSPKVTCWRDNRNIKLHCLIPGNFISSLLHIYQLSMP